jgi:hypothetical protein
MTEILDKAYAYVMLNNKATNAYHNNEHILMVFRNSMMLFDMYRKEYELKSTDRNELGLAALFHDFNHSGRWKYLHQCGLCLSC